MKNASLVLISIGTSLLFAGCASNPDHDKTARNAAIGAAAGAVIGGVVGHQSGETGEGAALGAAVGGVAGAATGAAQDRRERAAENEQYSSDYYRELLTPDEVATLEARARASGRTSYRLTDYLTEEEKANLRRRAEQRRSREIGG